MSPDVFTVVRQIGTVHVDAARTASAVRSIDNGDYSIPDLFEAICASSVTAFAIEALRSAQLGAASQELLTMLTEYETADRAWGAAVIEPMRKVVAKAAEEGGHVIKGLANQSFYPEPALRHMGDVDLYFPTCAASLGMVKWLRSEGWEWDTAEFPWIKWHESGLLYGQFSMVLPGSAEPPARVDLHFGPFSIGHAEMVPLIGWRPGRALGVSVQVPCTETAIALTAAHAFNDQLISMKDINDLHCLLCPGIDWIAMVELCRSVGTDAVLGRYLLEARRAYPDDDLPSLPDVSSLGNMKPDRLPRARAFASYAYHGAVTRGSSRHHAVWLGFDAYRYYTSDLSPRGSTLSTLLPTGAQRRRYRCWRLLPEQTWKGLPVAPSVPGPVREERLAGELELLLADRAAAVRLSDDVFVPTVWGDVHPQSVALAAHLAGTRL